MLTLTPLETRESPVALDWVFSLDPWVQARESAVRAAGDELAAAVTRPDVPRITVRVEPLPAGDRDGRLADGRPWRWTGEGEVRFDTSRTWDVVYHFASVVQHEVAHVLGVEGHTDKVGDILNKAAPLVTRPARLTEASADLLRDAGWQVAVPAEPAEVYPYTESHPYTGPLVRVASPWGDGWALTPPRVAAEWGLRLTPEGG